MLSLGVASGQDNLVAIASALAHIGDVGTRFPTWWVTIAASAIVVLTVEHAALKYGGMRHVLRAMRRQGSAVLAAGLTVAAFALIAPACQSGSARGPLPDLISDPPKPSFFKEILDANGEPHLVVTFDGYVHNIGEGVLDVTGNPQEADGMKQRVRNDDGWEEIGSPTVRFETDDGHNHFHLIEAVEYVLWDEARGAQTAIGSKIGFCLVDSEQMVPGTDAAYNEEMNSFCQEGNPDATDLQMGITQGWRDNYDATTTLQWVDVSNVAPGRYWIGAITDPNDEIVESNEQNNGLVYSDYTVAVPGFAPEPQSDVIVDGPDASITLTSRTYGDVTRAIYTIVSDPTSGTVDVPVGVDLDSPVITYRPDPGFEGTDRIEFSVHDANSRYPLERPTATIELTVRRGAGPAADAAAETADLAVLTPPSTFFEVAVGEAFDVDIAVSTASGAPARLYARGLPAGLTVEPTGRIAGAAVAAGIYDVELVAVGASGVPATTVAVTWVVNPADPSMNLVHAPDRSSVVDVPLRIRLGTSGLGLAFEAEGLPPGVTVEPDQPVLAGTPTQTGVFEVEVRQLDGSRVVAETKFTWTIRPS